MRDEHLQRWLREARKEETVVEAAAEKAGKAEGGMTTLSEVEAEA